MQKTVLGCSGCIARDSNVQWKLRVVDVLCCSPGSSSGLLMLLKLYSQVTVDVGQAAHHKAQSRLWNVLYSDLLAGLSTLAIVAPGQWSSSPGLCLQYSVCEHDLYAF